jgi:hypothetical protein
LIFAVEGGAAFAVKAAGVAPGVNRLPAHPASAAERTHTLKAASRRIRGIARVGSPVHSKNLGCMTSGAPAEAWIDGAIANERALLEHHRKQFVHEPSRERLHAVRTTARRLRSLLEDVAGAHERRGLAKRVKRTARYTDEARDAAVLRDLLERTVDAAECDAARAFLRSLKKRERTATRFARKALRRLRFEES